MKIKSKKQNRFQNLIFISSISILFLVSFYVFESCSEETAIVNMEEELIPRTSTKTPQQIVTEFKTIWEGTTDASRTHTATKAILGVETLLNYQYDDFTHAISDWHKTTETKTVSKINGEITDLVVLEIYDEALKVLECHFESITNSNKKEIFVDINVTDETSNSVEFEIINILGTYNLNMSVQQKSFVSGDDWRVFWGGTCLDPSVNMTASELIGRYNKWNLVSLQPVSITDWFSDPQSVEYAYDDNENWYALNPNDAIPNDGIMDYFIWNDNEVSTNYNVYCLEHNEMNYYLNNAETEALKFENTLNKKLMDFEMWEDFTLNVQSGLFNTYAWFGEGQYATRNTDLTRIPLTLGQCRDNL